MAVRIAALFLSLAVCLVPHVLWSIARIKSPWPRIFLETAARAVGVKVRVSNPWTDHGRDVIILANHISWIDILALGGATGTSFVAHDGIGRWPVVGWLAAQNGTIFVERDRRYGIGQQVKALQAAMLKHLPVTIFPEGTTGDGLTLLPFKPSLIAALVPPPRNVTIIPLHIDYGPAAGEIAWFGNEPAGANVDRLLRRRGPLRVTLHFLEPIDPIIYPDRKVIATLARERIARSMELRQRPSDCASPAL